MFLAWRAVNVLKLVRLIARSCGTALISMAIAGPIAAAPPSADDISRWGIVCFCLHSRTTPQRVIKQDDNGRLLYRARPGLTQAQLRREGFPAPDEQLRLLQQWSLLSRTGDRFRTTFPMVGPDQMAVLRPKVRTLADGIAVQIAPDVARLRDILTRQGYPASHYAVVFSYVLDGLVWEELDRRHALPSSVPTADHPEWNGALWAFSPLRPDVEGTNEIAVDAVVLKSLWNERSLAAARTVTPAADIKPLLAEVGLGSVRGFPRATPAARMFIDAAGRLTVPLIREDNADPIRKVGHELAGKVVRVLNAPKARRLAANIRGATAEEGLLIITHELMWDIIARLTESGAVERPVVLTSTVQINDAVLLPLFFITYQP